MRLSLLCFLSFAVPVLPGQEGTPNLQSIAGRLDRLERENDALRAELAALREELSRLSAAERQPPPSERLDVHESRLSELAQTRVQAASRFPIQITGMALFNAFWNGRYGGDQQFPTTAQPAAGRANAGGTFRQSVLGFRFHGPEIARGGKVSGTLYADFFSGTGNSLNQLMRIRVASIQVDWKNYTVAAGQEKPLIAPREPTSLAQVGVSPLTAAGNLWRWLPQARIERRVSFTKSSGLHAAAAILQTSETATVVADEYAATVAPARPGIEGRIEYWRYSPPGRRIEIAPGFHTSTTFAAGGRAPSRIYSLDWLLQPAKRLDFTGAVFVGKNVTVLGALRQGFLIVNGRPRSVRSRGGWGQLAYRLNPRLSFHGFAGQQDDRNSDLLPGRIGKNLAWGANSIYRLAPNVLVSFEGATIRTNYLGAGLRTVNHYDLALAYQF